VKRALSAILGFLILPILFALPVWLPLLMGASGQELERLQMNAYPLYRIIPSLCASGLALTWLLRSRFFGSLVVASVIGLASGFVASLVTYATYGLPIVNVRPFFITIPMMGATCGLFRSRWRQGSSQRQGATAMAHVSSSSCNRRSKCRPAR
jgi:hypothetical protein